MACRAEFELVKIMFAFLREVSFFRERESIFSFTGFVSSFEMIGVLGHDYAL